MPIMMKYEGITGESELKGKKGFCELLTLQWGLRVSASAVKASERGDADRKLDEILVTRLLDGSSAAFMREAVTGRFDRKVEIHFLRTGPGAGASLREYAIYTLEKCGISAYSVNSGGDIPTETMSLNFTKLQFKSFNVKDDLSAVPDTAFYDVTTGQGG